MPVPGSSGTGTVASGPSPAHCLCRCNSCRTPVATSVLGPITHRRPCDRFTGRRRAAAQDQSRQRGAHRRRCGRARRDHVDPRRHRRVGRAEHLPERVQHRRRRRRLDDDRLHPVAGRGHSAVRVGRGPLRHQERLFTSVVLFTLGSALCALASSIGMLCRVPDDPGTRRRPADAGRHDDPHQGRGPGTDR